MAYTSNQINDVFQKSLNRPATDYEIEQFKNSSPQTLATVKDTYTKLNKDSSLVDYLKYSGQNPESRFELAQKYGINNLGTAEGNTALLTALKSGQTPQTQTTVQGSIIAPKPTGTQTQPNPKTDTNNSIQGSITPKTGTEGTTESDPKKQVDDAYKVQQEKQKAVSDIDATLSKIKSDKIAEITRSGGVVNESSLQAEILRENAPLLAYRKQLAGEYTQANQNYQKALTEYRNQTNLAEKQREFGITSAQKQSQIENAQNKIQKVNVYDEYGNVVGQKLVTVNTSTGTKYDMSGTPVQGTSDGVVTTTKAPATIPMDNSEKVDVSANGYTTANVIYNGKNTQLTQSALDQAAIKYLIDGSLPAGAKTTKGVGFVQNNAIRARAGQLDPGGNLAANKALLTSYSNTLKKQVDYSTTVTRALAAADKGFQRIIDVYGKKGINSYDTPISNIINNATNYGLGNQDVSAFRAALVEVGNEYQQVFARSGQVTESVRATSKEVMDGNISLNDLQKVVDELQAQGKIVVDQSSKTVQDTLNNIRGIVPGASQTTPTEKPQVISNDQIPEGYYQASDGLLYKK